MSSPLPIDNYPLQPWEQPDEPVGNFTVIGLDNNRRALNVALTIAALVLGGAIIGAGIAALSLVMSGGFTAVLIPAGLVCLGWGAGIGVGLATVSACLTILLSKCVDCCSEEEEYYEENEMEEATNWKSILGALPPPTETPRIVASQPVQSTNDTDTDALDMDELLRDFLGGEEEDSSFVDVESAMGTFKVELTEEEDTLFREAIAWHYPGQDELGQKVFDRIWRQGRQKIIEYINEHPVPVE